MNLRTDAFMAVLDRCRNATTAEIGGPTICSGWPGLLFVQQCLEQTAGASVLDLRQAAVRWRSLDAPEPDVPVEVRGSFLYGTRGRRWAERRLSGVDGKDFAPPARALGFDTFANDGPVYLASDSPDPPGWADFIHQEFLHFERGRKSGRALPLGFAHGVAGLLFRALLLNEPSPVEGDRVRRGLDWLAGLRTEDDGCARWPVREGQPVHHSWVASSLCSGSVGHALVYLEAAIRLDCDAYLDIAQKALAASADESEMNLGFCCGHAGRAMVVSRFLRSGIRPRATEAEDTLLRLWARVPSRLAHDMLRPLSGLPSCLPALHAEEPSSRALDLFLPPPLRPREPPSPPYPKRSS
ncbi:MAG: lanthionine synthetase LanC family protein [Nannocystales bacterium]